MDISCLCVAVWELRREYTRLFGLSIKYELHVRKHASLNVGPDKSLVFSILVLVNGPRIANLSCQY